MAEKQKEENRTGKQAAAKKAAAKKPKPAAEKPSAEEELKPAPGEEEKAGTPEEARREEAAEEEKERVSEEEFRRMVEESLEGVTVSDIVLTVMNELASVGYMKMGLPESVNLKYRDFAQAQLAIDSLEGLIKGAEGKIPEEVLRPFRGTLANLQMNFVQLKRA